MCVVQKCVVNSRHTVNNVLSVYLLFGFCTRYMYLMCNTKMCCELEAHYLCIYCSDSALAMCIICLYNWEMAVYLLNLCFCFCFGLPFLNGSVHSMWRLSSEMFRLKDGNSVERVQRTWGYRHERAGSQSASPCDSCMDCCEKDSNIADFSSTPCMY